MMPGVHADLATTSIYLRDCPREVEADRVERAMWGRRADDSVRQFRMAIEVFRLLLDALQVKGCSFDALDEVRRVLATLGGRRRDLPRGPREIQ
jgi:hypothetical protein